MTFNQLDKGGEIMSDKESPQSSYSEYRKKVKEARKNSEEPSLSKAMFSRKGKSGEDESFSSRMEDYTYDSSEYQKKKWEYEDKHPVPLKRFLIVLGVIVVILLVFVLVNQAHGLSPDSQTVLSLFPPQKNQNLALLFSEIQEF